MKIDFHEETDMLSKLKTATSEWPDPNKWDWPLVDTNRRAASGAEWRPNTDLSLIPW